tara:strand:+ start:998 stop:1285 length:288 start_codon:yes stop_codon:yes gene_type:complete
MLSFLISLGFVEGTDFYCEYKQVLSNGSVRIFDFYFPARKIALEADGAYWHRNAWKDHFKDISCSWDGIKVIRFTEEHILHAPQQIKTRLRALFL